MGKLFVTILLVAVFEGGIRKWVSVDYTAPLVLLRDCLAVYGIFLSIQSGKLAVDQKTWQGLWLWSALVLCWGLGQLIINQSSPLAFIVGLRFWLLYVWFAYAAAAMLTADDFRYITKTILWILVFMAPLAVVQFYLPPTAFLNKQLDDDELAVFLVTIDIVRTTGTFSFALGYSTFLAIANPFVLSLLAPGGLLKGNKWLPSVLILVLAIATIVSGSRAALIMFGLMVVVYIAVTLGQPKAARQGSVLPQLLAMLLIIAAVPYVFFGAVDAMEDRIERAAEAEDFSERLTDMFFGESSAYEKLTFLGHGVGAGNN